MPQVSKEEGYRFERYGGASRFASYACQIAEILKTVPVNVLEIGVGDGVVGGYLKRQTAIRYTCADIADDLKPDVVADVRRLPFPDGSFDTVCAFEILEHIPFQDFEKAFSELVRVARKYVLISLPHFGPPVKFLLKLPFLPELSFAYKIPYPRAHVFNGQHYWEIGNERLSAAAHPRVACEVR
jgi:ubiquinone/menaquinone biosynthesis C-methylase UbiE